MGCKSDITCCIHSSISAWLSDGTGGFLVEFGFRDFFIAHSPLNELVAGAGVGTTAGMKGALFFRRPAQCPG
jgi:hypothetical protein